MLSWRSSSCCTSSSWRRCWILLLASSGVVRHLHVVEANASSAARKRPIQIINNSKSPFKVYWVNPGTREESLMSEAGVMPGTEFPLDSWVGHEFVAKETQAGASGTCKRAPNGVCRTVFFKVSENDDQAVRINEDYEALFVDNKIKAQQKAGELLVECQTRAKSRMNNTNSSNVDPDEAVRVMDELVRCVEGGVAGTLERLNEEIAFQANVRTGIAAKLENYTCLDTTLGSTADVREEVWNNARTGKQHAVHIKHDRPVSRIHVVENFIDEEECLAMEAAAAKSLHRATVADGKGGSRVSENRKAMQAGITVDWPKEDSGDAIARLSRRVYDYCNHVLGLDIKEHGQEDLMSIQYEGRGFEDAAPDQYTPHCDGDCTGLPHKFGQRMATMVMYCTVPDDDGGGHTNFRNAGVHVKPQPGNAIFFSYIDPVTKVMDTGFTEHSGCPVYKGSKKIVTQWIRYGVDTENPWNSFNTLGVKYSDLKEFEEGGGAEDANATDAPNTNAETTSNEAAMEDDDEAEFDNEDDDEAEFDNEDDDEVFGEDGDEL